MGDRHRLKHKLQISVSYGDLEKLRSIASSNGYRPGRMAELLICWVTEETEKRNWQLKPRGETGKNKLLVRVSDETFSLIQNQSLATVQPLGYIGSVHLQWGIWACGLEVISSHLAINKEVISTVFSGTMAS